jgi:TolB-like protein
MQRLITELKRRNVFRVGVAYLALAWVVIQITDMAVPALNLPESLQGIVFYIGMVGFPFALFFAWAFELTPEGLKREHEVDRTVSVTQHTGRKLDFAIIGMLVVAVAFLIIDKYMLHPATELELSENEQPTSTVGETTGYDSIGVLPFTNISNDPEQEYFSDGIAEELLNALAKLKNLQVAARTSSFAFKGKNQDITEIGNALKVDTVLEGSVRKSGTRLRITAQLIDVANGYHLWSETYDRELTDVFAIQDELTVAIVSALKVHLNVGEVAGATVATDNWEAYDAYLKGLHAIRNRTDESVAAAMGYFEEATRREPEFAAALARQAQAVLLSVPYGGAAKDNAIATSEALLDRALAADPDLAEAHATRGYLLLETNNCEAALLSFEKALALNPGLVEAIHWSALCLTFRGSLRESLQLEQRAHHLDPLHAAVFTVLSDFKFTYGMEADLNIEAAQNNYPDRYFNYQISERFVRHAWAEAMELVRSDPDHQLSLIFESILSTVLAMENEALLARLGAPGQIPVHDARLFTLMSFDYFDRAEAYLKGLDKSDLQDASPVSYRGHIQYLRGQLDRAEISLLQGIKTYENRNYIAPFNALSRLGLSISLADVLRRNGNIESSRASLREARETIELLKRNGARRGFQLAEARLSVLEGDTAAAVRLLKTADDHGTVGWYDFEDPILKRLARDPGFIALKVRFYEHLNAERAKLDWPPVDEKPR